MPAGDRASVGSTMRDVAREAGVSKALVSIVFRGVPGASPENRARVFAAAERLGYRTNRTASLLARSRTRQLGVVADLHSSFHAEVVDAVQSSADAAGYQMVLAPRTASHGERQAVTTALEFRCEALLLVGSGLDDDALADLAAQAPTVVVGRRLDVDSVDTVRSSDEVGMEQVVDHLVSLGHTRIAHVDGGDGAIAAARRVGFESGMRRHGLDLAGLVVSGGGSEADGREAARQLLDRPRRPTAIAAFNDHCALGVMDVCAEDGAAPRAEVAITGYDDTPLARLHAINLTSVRQETSELARLAVAAAVERLDDGRVRTRDTVLMPRLVARASTLGVARPI